MPSTHGAAETPASAPSHPSLLDQSGPSALLLSFRTEPGGWHQFPKSSHRPPFQPTPEALAWVRSRGCVCVCLCEWGSPDFLCPPSPRMGPCWDDAESHACHLHREGAMFGTITWKRAREGAGAWGGEGDAAEADPSGEHVHRGTEWGGAADAQNRVPRRGGDSHTQHFAFRANHNCGLSESPGHVAAWSAG